MAFPDFDLARYNKSFSQALYERVIAQPKALVDARATLEARKLHNLHRQVGCEIHRLESFTRLKASKHGILFSEVEAEHNTEEFVARFFCKRFPSFVIVISSARGCFIARFERNRLVVEHDLSSLRDIIKALERDLPVDDIMSYVSDIDDEKAWDIYYDSQFLRSRENKRYFLKSIPKKLHSHAGLKKENKAYSGCRCLDEFL